MAYEWIIDALDETWTSIDRLLRDQPEQSFDAPTPCEGWSVRDVVSHLLGFESMLRGGPVPSFEGEWPGYVKNPIGELNEAFVQSHRDQSGIEVLNQFREVARQSLDALRALSVEQWDKVGWSPEGDRPYHRFQETRVLDSWIHLQDIRDALLRPEDDHGPGEEIVVNRFEATLPYVIGKRMKAPEGTVVQINLSGHLARVIVIEVQGGRAVASSNVSGPADLEITTPVALFWRRAAGRISAGAFLNASATVVYGNQALASSFAQALATMI